MDASQNGLKLKPSHIIGNSRGGEKINSFGLVKVSEGYFLIAIKIKTPMKTFSLRTISYTQFTLPLVPPLSSPWVA